MTEATDWKAQLLGAAGFSDDELRDAARANEEAAAAKQEKGTSAQRGKLAIFVEKKGRGGKTATIITGFECPDSELKEIASRLKNTLGCGGSCRDGEILVQGSRREEAAAALRRMGFKI